MNQTFASKKLTRLFRAFIVAGAVFAAGASASATAGAHDKPTIVLVHGAFAESASWNGVIARLQADGYTAIAASNPLRSVKSDGESVAGVLSTIHGPVVLVGHSYGGSVISNTAARKGQVVAYVFVAAFAPEVGESALALSGKFPGSTLGPTLLPPVSIGGTAKDLYIDPAKFGAQFAADVPADQARLMAATQRPVTDAALAEKSGMALWQGVPTYFIYGDADKNIPPAAEQFMAKRAKAVKVVSVPGASHVVMVSHPDDVAALIELAAGK